MKFPPRKLATRSSGFVISLEFLLVVALVVIPLMIGMILLGRKLVTLYLNQVAMMEQPLARPVVWDSSLTAKPVGPVMGYDRFEAPLVLYRHRTGIPVGADEFTPGVLLGVRPFRFTTTSRTYYDTTGCTGFAYVKSSLSGIGPWPSVGFISQTQGLNYAMGAENILYREATPTVPYAGNIASYWVSQDVGDDSPVGPASTACVEITGVGLTVVSLDDSGTGTSVTGVTTVVNAFSPGDLVTIAGAGNPLYNGVYQITSASGRHFTFTGPGALGASLGGTATRGAAIPNLVATTLVADLDSGANFTPPYRVAFPTSVAGPPLVSTGG